MNDYRLTEQDLHELAWEIEHLLFTNAEPKEVPEECNRFIPKSIKIILEGHPKLLDYLFNYKTSGLCKSSEEIIESSRVLSSGEQVLIKLALDFWDGSGNTLLTEVYKILSPGLYKKVLKAINYAQAGN